MLELPPDVEIFQHEEPVYLIENMVLVFNLAVLECTSEPRSCSIGTRHALFFKCAPFAQHKAFTFPPGEQVTRTDHRNHH